MEKLDCEEVLKIYLEIKNDESLGGLDRDLAMSFARFIYIREHKDRSANIPDSPLKKKNVNKE